MSGVGEAPEGIDQGASERGAIAGQARAQNRSRSARGRSRVLERWRRFRIGTKAMLIIALVIVLAIPVGGYSYRDFFWGPRADARAAAHLLQKGELWTLGEILEEYRGDTDFAHYFTAAVSPRDLGDALGEVAGTENGQLLKSGLVEEKYDLLLVDLAGTVSIATHGIGNRELPESWTEEFVMATTDPSSFYEGRSGFFDSKGKVRERQDEANRSNLLLLLSRGFWSTDFLQSVTAAFYDLDVRLGSNAWPSVKFGGGAKYAPTPEGVFLTDGVVALSAALTANADAAEWAFVEFLPGNIDIEGTAYSIGRFVHWLLFERRYSAGEDGEPAGVTAVLTALSSAVDSFHWVEEDLDEIYHDPLADQWGPMHDIVVLEAIATDIDVDHGCSWHPRDYWNCAVYAADAVWQWVKAWGQVALGILSLAMFAPPPFSLIGVGAASTNATWYAIEGDYVNAGLSLALVVPALNFSRLVDSAGRQLLKHSALKRAAAAAPVRQRQLSAIPHFAQRPTLRADTQRQIIAKARKTEAGDFIDPNTGKVLAKNNRAEWDFGHKPGYEWRCFQNAAKRHDWSAEFLNELYNDPRFYQIEDRSTNRSGRFEGTKCLI